MLNSEILRHGRWSGPGWTANADCRPFEDAGHARILRAEEREVDGVDGFDNFVAKAHDLNEYAAEDRLRSVLCALGVASSQTTTVAGHPAWVEPLIRGGAGGHWRFVSVAAYRDRLGAAAGADGIDRLARAFMLYFAHIIHSNMQFVLDLQMNGIDRGRLGLLDRARVGLQLAGAYHQFQGEAASLETIAARMLAEHVGTVPREEIAGYLRRALVTPAAPCFHPVNGQAHVKALTAGALATASRSGLAKAARSLCDAVEDHGILKVRKCLARAAPQGFGGVGPLLAFCSEVSWKWG